MATDLEELVELTVETEEWLSEFCDDPEDEGAQELIAQHQTLIRRFKGTPENPVGSLETIRTSDLQAICAALRLQMEHDDCVCHPQECGEGCQRCRWCTSFTALERIGEQPMPQ